MGDKSQRNSRTCRFSESSRGPIIWDLKRFLFQDERASCCIWFLLPLGKRHNAYWASLEFRGNIYLIWVCYSDPFTEWPEKLPVLNESQNKSRLCNRSSCYASCSANWAIWLRRYDSTWSIGGTQDAVWSRWRPHPIGESKHKHLEFFSKAIFSPFERQLAATVTGP